MLSILVGLIVIGAAYAIIPLIGLPANIARIAQIILGVFFLVWLLNLFFGFAPGFGLRY